MTAAWVALVLLLAVVVMAGLGALILRYLNGGRVTLGAWMDEREKERAAREKRITIGGGP